MNYNEEENENFINSRDNYGHEEFWDIDKEECDAAEEILKGRCNEIAFMLYTMESALGELIESTLEIFISNIKCVESAEHLIECPEMKCINFKFDSTDCEIDFDNEDELQKINHILNKAIKEDTNTNIEENPLAGIGEIFFVKDGILLEYSQSTTF